MHGVVPRPPGRGPPGRRVGHPRRQHRPAVGLALPDRPERRRRQRRRVDRHGVRVVRVAGFGVRPAVGGRRRRCRARPAPGTAPARRPGPARPGRRRPASCARSWSGPLVRRRSARRRRPGRRWSWGSPRPAARRRPAAASSRRARSGPQPSAAVARRIGTVPSGSRGSSASAAVSSASVRAGARPPVRVPARGPVRVGRRVPVRVAPVVAVRAGDASWPAPGRRPGSADGRPVVVGDQGVQVPDQAEHHRRHRRHRDHDGPAGADVGQRRDAGRGERVVRGVAGDADRPIAPTALRRA